MNSHQSPYISYPKKAFHLLLELPISACKLWLLIITLNDYNLIRSVYLNSDEACDGLHNSLTMFCISVKLYYEIHLSFQNTNSNIGTPKNN